MSKARLSWWCLMFGNDGEVRSAFTVSEADANGGGVYYVRARDEAEATKLARRSRDADLLSARRAVYKAEGKCRCGRERDLPHARTCSACQRQSREGQARLARRQAGEVVPPPDRREAIAARKETDRADLRRDVLNEVLGACRRKKSLTSLQEWIWAELAKLGRRVA